MTLQLPDITIELIYFGYAHSESDIFIYIPEEKVFFTPDIDKQNKQLLYYVSKTKSQKIINYLKENNIGVSKTQLSSELKMHIDTVSKYLKILQNLNVISKEKHSRHLLYFINEK